jgi:hypothetical protein
MAAEDLSQLPFVNNSMMEGGVKSFILTLQFDDED